MASVPELNSGHLPDWCPGCGDFAILVAMKQAVSELNLPPENVVVVSGIGCSGKTPHFIKTYGFEGIHGRSLPAASAIKLANHELTVIAAGGDGDGYGIGMGHFIHAMRRNLDITYIVFNNQVYGLTKGQTAPTSDKGFVTKSTPFGVLEEPVNPLQLALASGATYIARGFSGNLKQLTELIKGGIAHKGFALIDVLQPCVTFNKVNTYQYYLQKAKPLTPEEQTQEKARAFALMQPQEKILTGLFYQEQRPTYEDGLPQIADVPLTKQPIDTIDVSAMLKKFE